MDLPPLSPCSLAFAWVCIKEPLIALSRFTRSFSAEAKESRPRERDDRGSRARRRMENDKQPWKREGRYSAAGAQGVRGRDVETEMREDKKTNRPSAAVLHGLF